MDLIISSKKKDFFFFFRLYGHQNREDLGERDWYALKMNWDGATAG